MLPSHEHRVSRNTWQPVLLTVCDAVGKMSYTPAAVVTVVTLVHLMGACRAPLASRGCCICPVVIVMRLVCHTNGVPGTPRVAVKHSPYVVGARPF